MSQKIEILYVVQSSAHYQLKSKERFPWVSGSLCYDINCKLSWNRNYKSGKFFQLKNNRLKFCQSLWWKTFFERQKKPTWLDNYNLSSLKNSYFHIKSISVLNSQSSLRKGQWLIKLKLIRSSATANIWMIIYKQSLINLSWQNKELASAWTNYVYVLAPQLSKKDIPY